MGGESRSVKYGQLPDYEIIASRWETHDHDDRNYIYWGRENRLYYEEYGGSNYNYEPRYDYSAAWPPNNRHPIDPYDTEIFPMGPKSTV